MHPSTTKPAGSRMRVLMFGWEFPPYRAGGLATATSGLVKGLVARGVSVTLVVPFAMDADAQPAFRLVGPGTEAPPRDGASAELRTLRIRSPLLPYDGRTGVGARHGRSTVLSAAGASPYAGDVLAEAERFAELGAAVARSTPHDVIAAHDWITFAAGVRAAEISGRPLVAHMHATERDRAGPTASRVIVERERDALRAATRVIANSRVLRDEVVREYDVPAGKIDVVHWGIDAPTEVPGNGAWSPFPVGTPVVLFLGRVTRQKGPDLFIEAAHRAAALVPEARFVVAGEGDLLPHVIERTVELGIAHRVHFTGGLDRPDVDRVIRLARVCVMPSVSEPYGLVALESLRSGTPCIVPRTAGVAEVIRHAFKVDVWDVDEMADRIVALLRHPSLHEEMRDHGAREAASPRFSLDEPARRTEAAYRRALLATRGFADA